MLGLSAGRAGGGRTSSPPSFGAVVLVPPVPTHLVLSQRMDGGHAHAPSVNTMPPRHVAVAGADSGGATAPDGCGVPLIPPVPTHWPPFQRVFGGQAHEPFVRTIPLLHPSGSVTGRVDCVSAGFAATVWQACSPAAPSLPATETQLRYDSAEPSVGIFTTIVKSRGPNSVPAAASRSSRTGPGDVHENGIVVGCAAHGSGGFIDTISAETLGLRASVIVTGALCAIGPGLKSVILRCNCCPADRIDRPSWSL